MSDVTEPRPGAFAVVTGAGGSVGPHLAAALASRGWPVALVVRPGSESRALETVSRLPGGGSATEAVGVDLTDEDAALAAFTGLEQRLGQCDLLLNAVGGFAAKPAHEAALADLQRLLGRNLVSAVNATRAVLPGMRERDKGFVLGMSAGAARNPAPGRTAYAAAKGAVSGYFRSLAAELVGTGVHAAVLSPMGTIDTAPNRAAMPSADFSAWIPVSSVVDAALYLATDPGVRELEVYAG